MRPSFVVSVLILSLFLTKAQGIRLEKGFLGAEQHKKHDEESNLLKRDNNEETAIPCKDEKCTGKIKNRKLVISASTTISKNVKKGGNEGVAVPHDEQYVDIADMDYAPARRKPPIHN